MVYEKSNAEIKWLLTDDVTWPWKVKTCDFNIRLERNISKTAGDTV